MSDKTQIDFFVAMNVTAARYRAAVDTDENVHITERPAVACSLREIHLQLVSSLASTPVPRLPINTAPDDIRDVTSYLLAVARHCDEWLKVVGNELCRNGASVDMRIFTDQFVGAIDGNATYDIESAALAMEENGRTKNA
jgi:hypothetical protein